MLNTIERIECQKCGTRQIAKLDGCHTCRSCGYFITQIERVLVDTEDEINFKEWSKKKCSNCKHASKSFKITGKSHVYCNHPKHDEGIKICEISQWDTLQESSNSCDTHEFLITKL